ncbi:MAG: hypothetical protein II233_06080, partial [Clostridia bacterium]|nr:hypothetical protein [Clostridia bacterium]
MRNILKKTAGVIITVSMLSTMLAGCANVDNTNVDNTNVDNTNVDSTDVDSTDVDNTNVDNTNTDNTNVDNTNVDNTTADNTNVDNTNPDNTNADNTNSNIEASSDSDTETDFDSGTKTVDPSTGKVVLELNGVSVEGTDNNYESISAYSVLDDDTKGTIVYEEVKDIICISMRYVNYALAVNSYTQEPETKLAEKVKVSIPYEEGMYILANENGVAYDIPAEYIDGKYVFETNRLGEFIISTVSTGKTEPTKTENVELAQQTITDERTGVTVSGMLPVDARLGVSLYCMDDTDASHVIDWATCYE